MSACRTWPRADVDAEAAADIDPRRFPTTDKAAVYKPALQLALNSQALRQGG